jgi:ABC-type transporter MlaC component
MRRTLIAAMAIAATFVSGVGVAAPDETQKQIMQRAQEAKKKLAGAQSATGQDRQRLMQEHMTMMQDMMGQMQQAQPRGTMSPEQRREWMDEHMTLMQEMMGQMRGQHQMMMGRDGMGGPGMMGGSGMGPGGMRGPGKGGPGSEK